MSAYEMITNYIFDGGLILILVLTLIQITPIKINPWSKIAVAVGKAINKDILQDIKELKTQINTTDKKVDKLNSVFYENTAREARDRILRFGDEVSHNVNHSKEHFQQILADITYYENYCQNHSEFKNNITMITSERIMNDYKARDLNNSFL